MEGRRRRNSDRKNRRLQNKSSPHCNNWLPVVPKWEKDFCKVVGSLDWETLLQMKRFAHLYEDVISWDDSAGEEAFSNAKRRYWAKKNGFFCHLPLPDPNVYIDEIDWDLKDDDNVGTELVMTSDVDEGHDPVVIFGDSLVPNQAYSLAGWGDEEDKLKVPDHVVIPPTNDKQDKQEENGDNNAWRFGDDESRPVGCTVATGDGWNDDWKWNYTIKDAIYQVEPGIEHLNWMQEGGTYLIRARP